MLFHLTIAALLNLATISAAPLDSRTSTFTSLLGVDANKKKLTFGHDGKFKIVSFSDLHYGEGEDEPWGPEQDFNTTNVHNVILDNEKPDFVMFNGDLITGENTYAANSTKYLDQVYRPAVQRKLPFSVSHGNHDNSFNITHQQILDYEMKNYGGRTGLSYTRSDVGPKPYGAGNYWVPIYAKQGDRVPAVVMWVFDSQGFVPGDSKQKIPEAGNKYWVDPDTVPQYIYSQANTMKKEWKIVPPALVFVHIPVKQSQAVANLTKLDGNSDDDPNPAVQGFLGKAYTGLDQTFFDALVWLNDKRGNVLAVTSGHDHGNSYCGKGDVSRNLPLCFDGHSGYGGYDTKNSKVRNGRIFDLDLKDLTCDKPSVKTYNSFEDKSRKNYITLGPIFFNPPRL